MGKKEWFAKKASPSKFMSCSNGKNFSCKSSCKKKHLTEEQVKKYKSKMNEWIDESKSVYVCEDLACKLICYINLGVINKWV